MKNRIQVLLVRFLSLIPLLTLVVSIGCNKFEPEEYDDGITVKDYDGNVYPIVKIGDQIWMAENLKVTHFPDGTPIPLLKDNSDWEALESYGKGYCWYNNEISNSNKYGGLYSWGAAMNGASSSSTNPSGVQGVCPAGWHLPSDSEWKELELHLGMSQLLADDLGWRGSNEGGMLKAVGNAHWLNPNSGATNESGFSAQPGGLRQGVGFGRLNEAAFFYTSSAEYSGGYIYTYIRRLWYDRGTISRSNGLSAGEAFSVRCVKD